MKVLGISGSNRKEGNTALLVKTILAHVDAAEDTEITTEFISLAGKKINPCTGCELCKEQKWCVIQNDDWGPVTEKIMECDVLVLGSPTYYYDVSGHLKNFMDRTYSLYHDRKLAGRNAVVVSVCAERGCERCLETLEGFVNTHEFSYLGYVSGRGYRPGDVLEDTNAMEKSKQAAQKIINLIKRSS
jgi:multimeric flavodoxin WrbA